MLWHGWLPCFEVNSRLQKRILNSGGILGCALSHSTRSYMQEENRASAPEPGLAAGRPRQCPAPILRAPPPRFCTNARTPRPDFTARISQKGKPTTCGGAPPGCAKPEARRAPPFSGGALRAAAESGPHGGTEGGQEARADRQPPSPYELALLPREHLGQAAALVPKSVF